MIRVLGIKTKTIQCLSCWWDRPFSAWVWVLIILGGGVEFRQGKSLGGHIWCQECRWKIFWPIIFPLSTHTMLKYPLKVDLPSLWIGLHPTSLVGGWVTRVHYCWGFTLPLYGVIQFILLSLRGVFGRIGDWLRIEFSWVPPLGKEQDVFFWSCFSLSTPLG